MISLVMVHKFADYNQWMNHKLYDAAAKMSDQTRKADVGAFFKSLHGTLNHILWADLVWLRRLAGRETPLPPLGHIIHEDFDQMRALREDTDQVISQWTQGLTEAWLAEDLIWRAGADNIERRQPRWLLVLHMFNHQTHHRGQATTLLSQAGLDVGVTDLPRM